MNTLDLQLKKIVIFLNPQTTTDDKKWATAFTPSIVIGGVGFITGSKA